MSEILTPGTPNGIHLPGATPVQKLSIDSEVVQTPRGPMVRFNTCVWGISSELLEMIADKVAERVIEKLAPLFGLGGESVPEPDERESENEDRPGVGPDAPGPEWQASQEK